jgi:hypothetical protein
MIFTFTTVGIFHILASERLNWCTIYPQLRYYFGNGLAMVMEDAVVGIVKAYIAMGKRPDEKNLLQEKDEQSKGKKYPSALLYPSLGIRLVGYLWVFSFDFWATTRLIYLSHQCNVQYNQV